MAKIHARNILPNEMDSFEQLAQEHGTILSSQLWLNIVAPTCIRVGLFQKDGQLIGGFVCQVTPLKIFKVIAPPVLTPHCGLFFKKLGATKSSSLQMDKQVGEAIVEWFDSQSVSTVHLPFPTEFVDMQVFNWAGYSVGTKYTYRIDLRRELETVMADMSSATKNIIKKAKNDDVQVRASKSGEEVHAVLTEALASKSGGHKLDIDSKQLQALLESESAFALVAEKEKKIIAGGFFIYDDEASYYILGGVVRSHGKSGAGSLLISDAIEKSISLGLNVFDFEGSMNPGIEHFFRGFGGDLQPYFQIIKAKRLQRRLLRLRGRKEF